MGSRGNQWRKPNSLVSILWKKQNRKCCYCDIEMLKPIDQWDGLGPTTATRERLNPASSGGEYTRDNMALACLKCNTSRPSDVSWLEYKTSMEAV